MKSNPTFRLVNLTDRSDVIHRISEAESELEELLDAPVALIAYVKEAETPWGREGESHESTHCS
jgi:hypothetical protein